MFSLFKRSLFFLWIVLPFSCAFAAPRILVLGDSISAGYGLNPDTGWVSLLQKTLQKKDPEIQVINASVSGGTTSNGLAQLPGLLERHQPTLLIIELGGNDALRGLSLSQLKKNLLSMIALAKQHHASVILLGIRIPPNYGKAYASGFENVFQEVSNETGVILLPRFLNGVDDNPAFMQADGIHPNAQAQTILLKNIETVLPTSF